MGRVAIIGGGAAGVIAAIVASKNGAEVEIFEHNSRLAKKILASGNGRCNISNTHLGVERYLGDNPEFARYAIEQFSYESFEKFFRLLGLWVKAKDDGRVYPLSNEAKSVVSILKTAISNSSIIVHLGAEVLEVNKDGKQFSLSTRKSHKGFDKVLIATGSEAAPQLGGSALGYKIAKSFGHSILDRYPALVQLHLDSLVHKKMAGVKQSAEVTLYIDGKRSMLRQGDILFTGYGVSGFAILDISHLASEALMNNRRVSIGINFFSNSSRQVISSKIEKIATTLKSSTISQLLDGMIPSKMVQPILASLNINVELKSRELTPKQIKQIANMLIDWRFRVTSTHGFKHAEVSGGGVSTLEVDSKSMESLRVEGLYFAGEVLDIVGERGGYNLHFAWASGFIAGNSISK